MPYDRRGPAHDDLRFVRPRIPAPLAAAPVIVIVDAFAQFGEQLTVGAACTSATSNVETSVVPVHRRRTSVVVPPEVCVDHDARNTVPPSVHVSVAIAALADPHGDGSGTVTVSADCASVSNSEITDRIDVSSAEARASRPARAT